MSNTPPPLPSINRLVGEMLTKIRRINRVKWTMWAFLIGAFLVALLTFVVGVHWFLSVVVALIGVALASFFSVRSLPSDSEVIADIGSENPELKYLLSTAHQAESQKESGYLAKQVIKEAVNKSISKKVALNHSAEFLTQITRYRFGAIALFIGSVILCFLLRPDSVSSIAETNQPDAPKVDSVLDIQVNPGDVEVEKESRLVITALFPTELPDNATLVVDCLNGEFTRRLSMKKNLDDPEFGAMVESIPGDGYYRIETGDGKQSENFRITTFELPELVQSDAKVLPPENSDREPTLTEDTYLARVFEGDAVEWGLSFNKPIRSGKLVAKDGTEIQLEPSTTDSGKMTIATRPEKSERYELILEDDQGRTNRNPPFLSVLVKKNLPTVVKLKFPTVDTRVTPIQEIVPEADIHDDMEIKAAGVTFRYQGKMQEVSLSLPEQEDEATLKKHRLRWPLDFEALQAKPNSLLTYHFWAEDEAPNSGNRRTESDMYFIEVRHFEEIFREVPPPPKGEKKPQTKDFLKLQKELINGTWKLVRRQPKEEALLKDGKTLAVMQQHVIKLIDDALC